MKPGCHQVQAVPDGFPGTWKEQAVAQVLETVLVLWLGRSSLPYSPLPLHPQRENAHLEMEGQAGNTPGPNRAGWGYSMASEEGARGTHLNKNNLLCNTRLND